MQCLNIRPCVLPNSSLRSLPREDRIALDEAQPVPERILGVERTLAPRTGDDFPCTLAVHVVLRKTAEFSRPRVDLLELLHREVEIVRAGFRLHATVRRIEQREDHAAARDLVPR